MYGQKVMIYKFIGIQQDLEVTVIRPSDYGIMAGFGNRIVFTKACNGHRTLCYSLW